MPAYISVPVASSIGLRPGYFGGSWLGVQHDPFQTGGDPNKENFKVQNLNLVSGLSVDRLEDRRHLLSGLDNIPRSADKTGIFDAMDRFDRNAYEFVSGRRARYAFDISREDPKNPRLVRTSHLGTKHPPGAAIGGSRGKIRHGPLRRLGPPLESALRHE